MTLTLFDGGAILNDIIKEEFWVDVNINIITDVTNYRR